ncbi:MAG: HNH endonuclease [Acidobacteriia bacterium]|nr:HNH endonuclease [Terriglobia bacterium]
MERKTNLFDQFHPIVRNDIPQSTEVGKLPPYKTHRYTLYGKQKRHCAGCEHHFPFRNLTVDHMVAKSKGVTDYPDNLHLLCAACNSMKGTIDQAAFLPRLRREGTGQ